MNTTNLKTIICSCLLSTMLIHSSAFAKTNGGAIASGSKVKVENVFNDTAKARTEYRSNTKFLNADKRLITTEDSVDKRTSRRMKLKHFEFFFNVNAKDLAEYSGVTIINIEDKRVIGELTTNDSEELAAFINEQIFTYTEESTEYNKGQYTADRYYNPANSVSMTFTKKANVSVVEVVNFNPNSALATHRETTPSNSGYENLAMGDEKDIQCIQSIENLSCGAWDNEFPGQTIYECKFLVTYKNSMGQVKEVEGSAAADTVSIDRGFVGGVAAYVFNVVETPVRALVRSRAKRVSVINYTKSKFPTCKN